MVVAIATIAILIAVVTWKAPARPQSFGFITGVALFGLTPTILLSAAEQFLPTGGPRKSPRQYLIYLQISSLYFASLTAVGGLSVVISNYVTGIIGIRPGIIDIGFISSSSAIGVIVVTVISMIIFDFFFYWYHRTLHKNAFLWQHHKFHHMDRQYDALTAYRQNWFQALANIIAIYAPMSVIFRIHNTSIFDMGFMGGLIVGLVTTLLGLNHSNLRIEFGRL